MMRLIVADDHQIVVDGLVHLLAEEPDVEVVCTANDGKALMGLLQKETADVVLMDIDMPGMNGIQACRKIKADSPAIAVVALTMITEASIIRKMLEAGASGYLMKNTGKEELLLCLQTVAKGGTYYAKEVAEIILSEITGKTDASSGPIPRLSRREKEILQLISQELTTGEIAERLHISFGTVETHRRNIMQKLGARNVVGMIRIAMEHNLLG